MPVGEARYGSGGEDAPDPRVKDRPLIKLVNDMKDVVPDGHREAVLRSLPAASGEDALLLTARKGWDRHLSERSAGHRGPGAVSTALILAAAADAAGGTP